MARSSLRPLVVFFEVRFSGVRLEFFMPLERLERVFKLPQLVSFSRAFSLRSCSLRFARIERRRATLCACAARFSRSAALVKR